MVAPKIPDWVPTPLVPAEESDRRRWLDGKTDAFSRDTLRLFATLDETRAREAALVLSSRALLDSLGEYVRQSMHANPEWRSGIRELEDAILASRRAAPAPPLPNPSSGSPAWSPPPHEERHQVRTISSGPMDPNGQRLHAVLERPDVQQAIAFVSQQLNDAMSTVHCAVEVNLSLEVSPLPGAPNDAALRGTVHPPTPADLSAMCAAEAGCACDTCRERLDRQRGLN